MAQSLVTEAGTVVIPQATVQYAVATANSGLATTGVLMLVGEADAGPRFSAEASLQDNAFGPDSLAEVQAKYGSGPLVDAFAAACAPANDPNIVGSFSTAILVKTNASAKAAAALLTWGDSPWLSAGGSQMSLADKSFGKSGNLIYYTITQKTAEVLPSTGAFTMLLPMAACNINLRANGGAAQAVALTTLETPVAMVTAINALTNIAATGGADKLIIGSVAGNLALTVVSGNSVQVNYDQNFAGTLPSVGDTMFISTTSAIKGGSNQNAGSYVITAAAAAQLTATKLMDASGTPGTLTPPINVSSTAVVSTSVDLKAYGAVTVSLEAGLPVNGVGKSLEINELTSGSELLSHLCYVLGTATKVGWVSKTGAPQLLVSGAETAVTLNTNRQKDNIQEALSAGGDIGLIIGYLGTTATLAIDDSTLTTTVTGGTGANQSVSLTDFPTIQDVATFLNSQPGYTAAVGNAILGQLPSVALDNVASMGIGTTFGSTGGRLKLDAYRFANQVNNNSVLVQLQNASAVVGQAAAGLPETVANLAYLAGGTKGATTDADITAGYAALEKVRGNFLVPLFSRDAAGDVADKLTDPASSWTLASVHSGARSHVLKMSSFKAKKNRQAFLSIRDTFNNDRQTASNIASYRCAVPFQDIKTSNSVGTPTQFQPWMGAVNAAAMQAAAFYKAIVAKFANITGAVQAAKDFDDGDDDAMEQALLAGLLPLRRADTGGWKWVSDQTSYGKDNNFVFNSIQATYVSDVIALTTAQRMEQAFVGQSVADVNAALALAFLETIMDDFKRLKLIAPSDDAPKGFKNPSIKISGTSMAVKFEVKLAGAIYFIPIFFLVSQVQQTA